MSRGVQRRLSSAALRERLDQARADLREDFLAQPNTQKFLHEWTAHVDDAVIALWQKLPPSLSEHALLLAVGGYGRDALFPYSDVDIAVVLKTPTREKDTLIDFETALWDLGLRIGYRVYSFDDFKTLAQWDITAQTAVIEYRYLAGQQKFFNAFRNTLKKHFDFAAFYRGKLAEQEERHLKYSDATYSLEPNIKESPGGLRDIHFIRWLIHAEELTDQSTPQTPWLTSSEWRMLRHEQNKLEGLRIHLHLLTGRAEERLLFDHQNELAERIGIPPSPNHQHRGEILMQRYYRTAQRVRRLNLLFAQLVFEYLTPLRVTRKLDESFRQCGSKLDIVCPDAFARHPSAIFDTFLHWQRQRNINGLSANILRALNRTHHLINESFRRDQNNQDKFIAFFRGQRTVTHATRIMNLYGILADYLPAFARIVGQMQHDLFHAYTVDEHTLMVIRNLRRLSITEHDHELPLCSQLMQDFENPEILFLAALFHDIGKGLGGDHSLKGAQIAYRFCRKHRLDHENTAFIVWLVKAHLWLSHTAQKNDIYNPNVVRAFARKVKNEKRLIALYLLTVTDICATGPNIYTPWKAQLLESLFLMTRAQLLQNDSPTTTTKKLPPRASTSDGNDDTQLWQLLDHTYIQRHSADDLAWHASVLASHLYTQKPCVNIRLLPKKAGLQFLVYLPDRPRLFAQLCIFFGSRQLNILDAQIHTTRHGYALDTFSVQTKDTCLLESDATERNRLAQQLIAYLDQPLPALPPLGKRPRRSRHYPLTPKIKISSNDDSSRDYTLEIIAGDRAGLLAHIASILMDVDINIKSARINTMGERVEDIFVLEGKALEQKENRAALENCLQTLLCMD